MRHGGLVAHLTLAGVGGHGQDGLLRLGHAGALHARRGAWPGRWTMGRAPASGRGPEPEAGRAAGWAGRCEPGRRGAGRGQLDVAGGLLFPGGGGGARGHLQAGEGLLGGFGRGLRRRDGSGFGGRRGILRPERARRPSAGEPRRTGLPPRAPAGARGGVRPSSPARPGPAWGVRVQDGARPWPAPADGAPSPPSRRRRACAARGG